MNTNERELAQLERADGEDRAELALVVVEVVARDEQGRITQYRGLREAGPHVVRAFYNDHLHKGSYKAQEGGPDQKDEPGVAE